MLACYRYIELNPGRAQMARHPREYCWSSYRTNAEAKASSLIEPHEQYRHLGRTADARREAYRALFRAYIDPQLVEEIRSATNGGYALGNERFQAEIAATLGRRAHRGRPGRPKIQDIETDKVKQAVLV